MHDLAALLAEVSRHFDRVPANVHVSWASNAQLLKETGSAFEIWALAWNHADGLFIGINEQLRAAPKYVLKYLVFHELLHFVLRPRGRCHHHRAFRVAERVWPDYVRANAWLDANESRVLR